MGLIKFKLEKTDDNILVFQILEQSPDIDSHLPFRMGDACKITKYAIPAIYQNEESASYCVYLRGRDTSYDYVECRIPFLDRHSLDEAHKIILLAFKRLSEKWTKD